jgi:hypothetical protein
MDPPLVAHLIPANCVVCSAVLPGSFANPAPVYDPYPTCRAVACRMVVSRRAEMGEAGFRYHLQLQMRHRRHELARTQMEARRRIVDQQENDAAWQTLRSRLPAALTPEPLHVLLPTGPQRASRMTAGRRDSYREHLVRIVAEARAPAPPPPSPPPAQAAAAALPASAIPGHLCALCGGGCCTRGGEKAYLAAATMRRFIDAHPGLADGAVVAAYLERVEDRTQTGSCINHTAQGCSLPRDMRSDTCNNYACESLASIHAAQRGPTSVHTVLILRRKQDNWRRTDARLDNPLNAYALLCENGVQRFSRAGLQLPAPAPAPAAGSQRAAAAIAANVS